MDNYFRNLGVIDEISDQATTCPGLSPSEASHDSPSLPSFSTEKTLVPSSPSTVPGDESTVELSSDAKRRLAILNGDFSPEKGWPCLAHIMAQKPHLESFCRFRELNVKNLLYYQVEIAEMETKLRFVEINDAAKKRTYANEANTMFLLPENSSREEIEQRDLVLEIRKRLREYSKMEQRLR